MPAQVAILLCWLAVAYLFHLNRNTSVRISRAAWLPAIWVALVGSRPVSAWLGAAPATTTAGNLDGSPVDAAVLGILVAIGMVILAGRSGQTRRYLAIITPIVLYSLYCLISITWSPIPVPALKRWIKDVGDVVMVLVICTGTQPLESLRQLYAKVGSVLFPFSFVLSRYTTLGRAWDNDGRLSIVGVTDNKNTLGLIVFVISLGLLWNLRSLLVNKGEPNRSRRMMGASIVFGLGVSLLGRAHSSTSVACFLLGSVLMLTMHLPVIRRRPSRVYWLCLAVFALGALAIFGGGAGGVASALGREGTFSGRTDIWAALIPAVSNPLMGSGFDSFWNSPNVLIFYRTLTLWHWWFPERLNEAHNGYLEVYVNLGAIGVSLIVLILATGISRGGKAYRVNREIGTLMLAYLVAGTIYNITECGFRTLNPMWIFILFAVVSVSGVKAGLFGSEPADRSQARKGSDRGQEAGAAGPRDRPDPSNADDSAVSGDWWTVHSHGSV
jgi:exopolysaccharide production protein ExoQ